MDKYIYIYVLLKNNDDDILTIKLPYDLINNYKYDINNSNYFSTFINVDYLLLHF